MKRVVNQEFIVTSPLNEKLSLLALQAELGSAIFKELINSEKYGLRLRFTVDVIEKNDAGKS
jgi:hypothetical protein